MPTANVCSTVPSRAAQRAAIAATSEESSPPERNTPTGTSPIIWRSTAWTSASRVPSCRSVPGGSGSISSGTAEAKWIRPSSGVHAWPGGNGST